jgi:uncharacterized membrane protein
MSNMPEYITRPASEIPEEVKEEIVKDAEQRLAPSLKKVDASVRGEIVQQTVAFAVEHIEGPLPPARVLKNYEDILLGAADRIISMAEKEQDHFHEMDLLSLKLPFGAEVVGSFLGALIIIMAVAGGIYCITSGHSVAGTLLAGGSLIPVALALIKGRQESKVSSTKTKAKR